MPKAAFTALLLLLAASCAPAPAPLVAERLRPLTLPLIEGRGEVVVPAGTPMVVNVWATWCEPCRREMRSLETLHTKLGPSGVRVVGISVDQDRNLAAEFVRAQRLTFPNAIDADARRLGAEFAITKFPTTLVIDASGAVRWREEAARDWSDEASVARVVAALGLAP